MITIIYSTNKGSSFIEKKNNQLRQSCDLPDVQILAYSNKNEYSLSQIYNKGISESKYEIVVCIYDEVVIEDGWGVRILYDFETNEDYGIIGKCGFCYFPKNGLCWDRVDRNTIGEVYNIVDGGHKKPYCYSANIPILQNCISIDGFFISFDKTKIKHKFDESIKGVDFCEHHFCLANFVDNVKIGVTSSFKVINFSKLNLDNDYNDARKVFVEKWGDYLPLEIKPDFIYAPKISYKNNERVAIIIPTKDKINLLFDCLNSFLSKCSNFDIFIADTGSSQENIEKIKSFISGRDNIKLIQYNYYNFAKINNDVFKKYIDDIYEYVLFSNNDIVVMNDVVSAMVSTHKKYKDVGTVGARLHYKDNTIQHEGIYAFRFQSMFHVAHIGLLSYYPKNVEERMVVGNTGALMMMKSSVFKECDMFNEDYKACFEDVEINFKCLLNKKNNFVNGSATAYHYESQTRKEDEKDLSNLQDDYCDVLVPFINKNRNELGKFIINRDIVFSQN